MEIRIAPSPAEGETIAVAIASGAEPSAAVPGLARLVVDGEATEERGRARLVRLDGRLVVAAGAGPVHEVDADAVRDAAAATARELQASVGGRVAWLLDSSLPLPPSEQARAAVEGFLLGGYDPGAWKTTAQSGRRLTTVTLAGDGGLASIVERAAAVAAWTNRARDLANRPGNDLTPTRLAEHAAAVAGERDGLTAEALGPEELREHRMGGLLGVGQGGHNEPRLIVLRWDPPEPSRSDVVLGLVGKGITFDTGGISLKSRDYMEDMKGDMAGGGAVVAALGAIAELGVPLRVLGVVAAAENMLGGGSFRPGDILTAANGKTIEITDTDAEGRLVLADALVHTRALGATHVVDFATLTATMERALGDLYAGVFSPDPAWLETVVAAGEASGDHAWPWPMHPRYRRFIESAFADLKNHNVRLQGTPVLAAEFLREFAGEGPWAHIDMAGTGFLTWPRGDYLSQKGGTGYGVRLAVELASRLADG
jgi:leucyl aminopeptidase